ncbi:MAG: hypothetical protein M3P27_13460 [Acidobacteriota bacterium]|nr:hypothetical protein [Acidobacteriota bacterium]
MRRKRPIEERPAFLRALARRRLSRDHSKVGKLPPPLRTSGTEDLTIERIQVEAWSTKRSKPMWFVSWLTKEGRVEASCFDQRAIYALQKARIADLTIKVRVRYGRGGHCTIVEVLA